MGVNSSLADKIKSLEGHEPPLQQYALINSQQNRYIWKSIYGYEPLVQFPIHISDSLIIQEQIKIYFFRHRHQLLQSSIYFKITHKRNQKKIDEIQKASIFYEDNLVSLKQLQYLTFQQALQFYYVGLKGFNLLYKKFGYFRINEDLFFINYHNKIKVWCNSKFEKLYPQNNANFVTNLPEQMEKKMVKQIIQIIKNKTNPLQIQRQGIDIGYILGGKSSTNFQSAIKKLRQLCRKNLWNIPQKLSSNKFKNMHQRLVSRIEIKANQKYSSRKKSKGLNLSVDLQKRNNSLNSYTPKQFIPHNINFNRSISMSQVNQRPIKVQQICQMHNNRQLHIPINNHNNLIQNTITHSTSQPLVTKQQLIKPPLPYNTQPKIIKKRKNIIFNKPNHLIRQVNPERKLTSQPGKSARSRDGQMTDLNKESHVLINYRNDFGVLRKIYDKEQTYKEQRYKEQRQKKQQQKKQIQKKQIYKEKKQIYKEQTIQNKQDNTWLVQQQSQSKLIDYSSLKKQTQIKQQQENNNDTQNLQKYNNNNSLKECKQNSEYNNIFEEWKKLNEKLKMHKLNINKTINNNNSVLSYSNNQQKQHKNVKIEKEKKTDYKFSTFENKGYTFDSIIKNQIYKQQIQAKNRKQFKSSFYENYLKLGKISNQQTNLQNIKNPQQIISKIYSPNIDPQILNDIQELRNSQSNNP